MYEYPQKLIDFLTEQEADGAEIVTTHNETSAVWIIKPSGLSDWYVVIEWMEGMDDFKLVNISGRALKRLMWEAGNE